MKYIDADLLRKELNKWRDVQPSTSGLPRKATYEAMGVIQTIDHVLYLIDSLQQEKPEVDIEQFIGNFMEKKDAETQGRWCEEDIIEAMNQSFALGLNAKKEQPKINIPSDGSGAMGETPPRFKLDVKPVEQEVDIEKIINDYFKDWKFDDELDIMVKPNNYSASFSDLRNIAKHFYELGLNARKEK